jgi:hypothetical protein
MAIQRATRKLCAAGAMLLLAGSLLCAQAQPEKVLVVTKPWSDAFDGTWWETLQEIDLSPTPAKERTTCLKTHDYYCAARYVDLSVSPLTDTKPELLKILQNVRICDLEPGDVEQALLAATFGTKAMSGGSWRIVADCEGHSKLLEIAEWVNVDEKKLQRASPRVASLFRFARLLSAEYSHNESKCPDEWKSDSRTHLSSLLDGLHSLALEDSSAFSALQRGRLNEPPAGVYTFSVDIDRSLLESSPDQPPAIFNIQGDAQLDLVAVVDPANGKVIRVERDPNATGDDGSLFWGARNSALSWQFRPGGPARVPFKVAFHCED